jgi:hypothetical protein
VSLQEQYFCAIFHKQQKPPCIPSLHLADLLLAQHCNIISAHALVQKYYPRNVARVNSPLDQVVQNDLPILHKLAKQVCCVCATSAQSERDFSAVGLIITQLRSGLSPQNVEEIQLLRSTQLLGIFTDEFALAE